MHAETKAELLALKSEAQAQESKTQAELLAMKTEMRQMRQDLMHGENENSLLFIMPHNNPL